MKKTKHMLAFEQLEAEMEVITISELMSIFGGTGSAQDIINYMEANGMTSWSSSSTGDVVGFSNSNFSSGGYYGSGGGFWAPSGSSSGGYSSNGGNSSNGGGGFDGGSGEINIQIDSGGAYLIDGQTYYSSSGVPYRKVSFDKGVTWIPEAMRIEPIIPAASGTIQTHSTPWSSVSTMYLSHLDAYNFLNDMGTGAAYIAGGMSPASLIPQMSIPALLVGGVYTIESFKWGDIETKYINSGNEAGIIITKSTVTVPNFGPTATYTIEDIYGNRYGTVFKPGS